MAVCKLCKKTFDKEYDADTFDIEMGYLSYSNLKKSLCAECAISSIRDEVKGIYFETCERCGKTFDLFKAKRRFDSKFSWNSGATLTDFWKDDILCCDCALQEAER